MRLIFFSFKRRYRKKELNNFLATRIYGKYFILNLGGPLKYFVAKILMFLKIGKAISCDGRPLIPDKSKGINFLHRNCAQLFSTPKNSFSEIDRKQCAKKVEIFEKFSKNVTSQKCSMKNHMFFN